MQFTLGSRKLRDNGHVMGSRRSHCEKGEDAKVIGIKRMIQETFEREMERWLRPGIVLAS